MARFYNHTTCKEIPRTIFYSKSTLISKASSVAAGLVFPIFLEHCTLGTCTTEALFLGEQVGHFTHAAAPRSLGVGASDAVDVVDRIDLRLVFPARLDGATPGALLVVADETLELVVIVWQRTNLALPFVGLGISGPNIGCTGGACIGRLRGRRSGCGELESACGLGTRPGGTELESTCKCRITRRFRTGLKSASGLGISFRGTELEPASGCITRHWGTGLKSANVSRGVGGCVVHVGRELFLFQAQVESSMALTTPHGNHAAGLVALERRKL